MIVSENINQHVLITYDSDKSPSYDEPVEIVVDGSHYAVDFEQLVQFVKAVSVIEAGRKLV